eukprot:TRINITY_DN1707_c0_g1_i1.p2 TRINITY_DN1707_c0_g1~~TRINITY_DN1707_c0_g1_i1.p2  ORF type:complete len:132 (+),score=28.47 TRINITY_DN1707_c0_g1_i1:140-535(+)
MDFKVDAKTLSLVGKIAGGVAAAGVLYTTLPKIRTWTFKRLLHYNTWMFHPKSTRTKLYITLTAFLGGREPTTFAFQDILPPLPVPPVEKTLTKYLAVRLPPSSRHFPAPPHTPLRPHPSCLENTRPVGPV